MNNYPDDVMTQSTHEAAKIAELQFACQCAEEIGDSCRNLFEVIRSSLEQLKERRALANERLCDVLAKKGSLRKKDYERMMDEILVILDEKEQDARDDISSFLRDQREFALTLKDLILNAIDFSSPELAARSGRLREEFVLIVSGQEERGMAVLKRLTDFQSEHSRVVAHLESLLHKREGIGAKDIKEMKYLVDHEWGAKSN